jgi:nitric oxide reductase large subunit
MSGAIFSAKNYKLIALSIVLLVIGYILLGQGPVYSAVSWKIAPVVLVAVYCALLPWAILSKTKEEKTKKEIAEAKAAVKTKHLEGV